MNTIQPTGFQQSVWTQSFQLNNFHTVLNNGEFQLFRSARPSLQGLKDAIRVKNLKTVVSLEDDAGAIANERQMCAQLGLNFISRPMSANGFQDDGYIQGTLQLVANAARQGGTLVHCYEGRDRTGLICAEFQTEIEHQTADQAVRTWMEDGFHGQQGLKDYFDWKHSYDGHEFN